MISISILSRSVGGSSGISTNHGVKEKRLQSVFPTRQSSDCFAGSFPLHWMLLNGSLVWRSFGVGCFWKIWRPTHPPTRRCLLSFCWECVYKLHIKSVRWVVLHPICMLPVWGRWSTVPDTSLESAGTTRSQVNYEKDPALFGLGFTHISFWIYIYIYISSPAACILNLLNMYHKCQ